MPIVHLKIIELLKHVIEVDTTELRVYATLDEAFSVYGNPPQNLTFQTDSCRTQGLRTEMKDADFILNESDFILAGVYDGHNGADVAAYANEQVKLRFEKELNSVDGNVHRAFEQLISKISMEIQNSDKLEQGTTAVIIYIDKKTN